MLDSLLLQIAKAAILREFDDSYVLDKEKILKEHPFLKEKAATFVTLEYKHALRGCIGSVVAHRSFFDDLIQNAVSAAFSDPRFPRLDEKELPYIAIEVSVLSEPEILEYTDFSDLVQKLEPNLDGLILTHKGRQSTFLPQVWEQLQSPEEFLEHLRIKAGLNPLVYDEHPLIKRYRVASIKNNLLDIDLPEDMQE